MTSATIPGLTGTDTAPTSHGELLAWVREVAELTQPDRVVFADGSDEEWDRLTAQLVEAGTFTRLNDEKKPNSFLGNSDPSDVARVESRTYICSREEIDAGPTNNWRPPAEMKAEILEFFTGAMRGRTLYVVPFSMAAVPMRVMMRIETTTYSESVISTPSFGSSAPSGPMQNGTTYMVRPRMQPR